MRLFVCEYPVYGHMSMVICLISQFWKSTNAVILVFLLCCSYFSYVSLVSVLIIYCGALLHVSSFVGCLRLLITNHSIVQNQPPGILRSDLALSSLTAYDSYVYALIEFPT